jgi:hypothetical protein
MTGATIGNAATAAGTNERTLRRRLHNLRALQSPSAEEPRQEPWSVLQWCRCRVGCSMSARWRGGSQHRDTSEQLVGVAEYELKMNVTPTPSPSRMIEAGCRRSDRVAAMWHSSGGRLGMVDCGRPSNKGRVRCE